MNYKCRLALRKASCEPALKWRRNAWLKTVHLSQSLMYDDDDEKPYASPTTHVSGNATSGGAIECVLDLREAIVPAACRARSERYLQESGLPAFVLAHSNCHWFRKRFLKSHKRKPASKILKLQFY